VEPDEYARIAAAEDDHWWYRSTRALAAQLLEPWLGSGQRILDAGCGPGGNGAWLTRHGRVTALDVAPDALRFVRARRPELQPVRADVRALPFPDRTFDVAVGITLLYAVPDDAAAAAELARVLAPGGALLLLEPAFAALRRAHDTTVHGLRRYRRAGLADLARRAGLTVRRTTYAYSFLAPPAAVLAVADRVRPRPGPAAGSDVERRDLDRVFAPLAGLERRRLRRGAVPVGTSVVLVATRGSRGR
jgi:ubiquinone/menaquinone biosynthesis C-methylase UbiE